MNRSGPIIIIEDSVDDQEMLRVAFNKINCTNEVIFFIESEKAYEWIKNSEVQAFLIISDINIPGLSGIELRDRLHADPVIKMKCIPFIFLTTSRASNPLMAAYSNSAQGFFFKPMEISSLANMLTAIIEYWKLSESP